MPQIFHILTESEPFTKGYGGVLARWVANVLRDDHKAQVLAPASDDSFQFEAGRVRVVEGLTAYKTFYEGGGYVLPWKLNLALLRNILTRHLADLKADDTVWVHNRPEFALALQSFVHSRGARLVLHLHNSHLVQWSESVTRRLEVDCFVFNSRFLEREALAKFSDLGHTEVLPSGPDAEAFYPATEAKAAAQKPVIVFSARLSPEKDVRTFVEAMEILQQRNVAVRGVVVGGSNFGGKEPTSYLEELRASAPANVSFEAFTQAGTMGRLLRHADVFCMPPCWHEPVSLQILEALASALPVVAMESGGIPENLAQSGGILIARNTAEQLAEALSLLACDAPTRERMASAAYLSYIHNFMWATIQAGYRKVVACELPAPPRRHRVGDYVTA